MSDLTPLPPRSRRKLPDEETTRNICAYVARGTFMWVAAVASGVSKGKFAEWMQGTTVEEQEFQFAVNQASAQARVACETVIAVKKPLDWLLHGPGRERPNEPGWTSQMALTGPKGGALEQIVTQTNKQAEDYSGFTVEEMRTLRTLQDKATKAAKDKEAKFEEAAARLNAADPDAKV